MAKIFIVVYYQEYDRWETPLKHTVRAFRTQGDAVEFAYAAETWVKEAYKDFRLGDEPITIKSPYDPECYCSDDRVWYEVEEVPYGNLAGESVATDAGAASPA